MSDSLTWSSFSPVSLVLDSQSSSNWSMLCGEISRVTHIVSCWSHMLCTHTHIHWLTHSYNTRWGSSTPWASCSSFLLSNFEKCSFLSGRWWQNILMVNYEGNLEFSNPVILVGNLALLPTGATGRKEIWLAHNKWDGKMVCPIQCH